MNSSRAERKPRVLVVDDEPGMRDLLRELLWEEGYEVLEASDGDGVLGMIDRQDIDLAIIDIFMPVVDGIELLTRFRKRGVATKTIAISGGGTNEGGQCLLDVARLLGAAATLEKPFDLGLLMSHVRRYSTSPLR